MGSGKKNDEKEEDKNEHEEGDEQDSDGDSNPRRSINIYYTGCSR